MIVGDVAEEQRRRERRRRRRVDRRHADRRRRRSAQRGRRARACRTRRAGTRGRSRARSGTSRTATRRRAGRRPSCAAARAASRPPGPPPRQQQRAAGGLAELRREQRAWRRAAGSPAPRPRSGVGQQQRCVGRLVGLRKPHDEPVVGPHRLDVDAESRRGLRRPRPSPRARGRGRRAARARTRASRRARRARARRRSSGRRARRRGRRLVGEVLDQVLGGLRVEVVLRASAARSAAVGRQRRAASRTSAPIARPSSSGRPARVALPERHLARLARRGRDEHAVVRDLLDAPASTRRAGTSRRRGSRRPSPRRARRRARVPARRRRGTRRRARGRGWCRRWRRRRAGRPRARVSLPVSAVPGEARPQLGELVGRVAAGQHVEHALEDAAAQRRRRAPPGARARTGRRRASRPSRPSRRSAARARRAGCAGSASPRPRPRASRGSRRRRRAGRRGTSGRSRRGSPRPTWWPARPMRCMPLATDGGASIWTTRSIAPMSMPSSSDEVATSARSVPALSASSISIALLARERAVVRRGRASRRRAR